MLCYNESLVPGRKIRFLAERKNLTQAERPVLRPLADGNQ